MKTIKSLWLALLLSFTIIASSKVAAMQKKSNEYELRSIKVAQQWMQSESSSVQAYALYMFVNLVSAFSTYETESSLERPPTSYSIP